MIGWIMVAVSVVLLLIIVLDRTLERSAEA